MEPNNTSIPTVRLAGPIELFSSAWSLFKVHWKVLVVIVSIPSVISLIGSLLLHTSNIALDIVAVILVILSIILSIAMTGAVIDTVRKISINSSEVIDIKGQYKFGFSVFWSIIYVSIIYIFVIMGSGVLFIIPAIIVGVYVGMYSYSLIVDGKKGFEALVESYSLIRDRWWGVLGRCIFIGLVTIVVSLVAMILVYFVSLLFGPGSQSMVSNIISAVIGLIFNICMAVISIVYIYKLYESLKSTRSQNVEVAKFKKWLKAFVIIGPIIMILGITSSIILASLSNARKISQNQTVIEQSNIIGDQLNGSIK